MRCSLWWIGPAVVFTMLGFPAPCCIAQSYQAGTGRADITPDGPIWMSGYGNRNKPSVGIDEHLFLKALALREGTQPPLVLITADLIGFPRSLTEEICQRIQQKVQVPRENILVVASHTHTGPVIGGGLEGMFDLQGKELESVVAYTKKLPEKAAAAVGDAVSKMNSVQLSYGRSHASFAMNRRVFRPGGVNFGANPEGPVDHDVPILRVDRSDGTLQAIVFGYACHCTTLDGNHYRIGGDWAGYAQDYLERANPGAVAFFVTGCGADANPEPRGKLEFARQHGLEMAGVVCQAIKGSRIPVSGPLKAAIEDVDLPFVQLPSREEFQKRLEDKNVFVRRHARRQLDLLEQKGKLPASYPCPVQSWQLGKDLTLLALGGEVVVDYDLRLKRELPGRQLWVAAYANDVFAYVPSVRILLEGGYEADFNLIYYGQPARFSNTVEETLIKKATELAKKVRP